MAPPGGRQYGLSSNELWIVECKSYLDSGGVGISAFDGSNPIFANWFKLFNTEHYDNAVASVVSKLLLEQRGRCGATLKAEAWPRLAADGSSDKEETAMTGDELDAMWVVRVGLQTLTHEGTTIEIRIDDDSVHYVVNGVECDSRYLEEGVSPREHVVAFKRRVVAEWEKGHWPPG